MSNLGLPRVPLDIIIGYLDRTSVMNLYLAGVAITECHFSANALATANSLNTDLFTGVSGYLRILNLSGVPDLDAPCLLSALAIMNSLVDLDVSYTNINMADFLGIAATRPTLTSIAINFTFGERNTVDKIDKVLVRVKETALPKYQQALKRFKNVHFVGRMGSRVHGALALLMLQCAELRNLTFTTRSAGEGSPLFFSAWPAPMVNTAQFQLYLLNTVTPYSLLNTPIYKEMDFKKYEVIIFRVNYKFYISNESKNQKVFATSRLKKIICKHFGGVAIEDLPEPLSFAALRDALDEAIFYQSDYACLFWDVDRTNFDSDSTFPLKLLKIFKEYYVFEVDASATPVPAEYDWYRVRTGLRKKLDYNAKFYKNQKVKLNIVITNTLRLDSMPKMDRDGDFLQKVTHLSLICVSGAVTGNPKLLAYFKDLLKSCTSLETLALVRFDITFLQHLNEAQRLRNILVYRFCPKETCRLLTYLSQCESLENIYLDGSSPFESLECLPELVPLLSKLSNLYHFCMHASVAASDAEVNETCKRVTSDVGRDALRIVFSRVESDILYHPYLSVFNLFYQLIPNPTHGCNVSKILTKR